MMKNAAEIFGMRIDPIDATTPSQSARARTGILTCSLFVSVFLFTQGICSVSAQEALPTPPRQPDEGPLHFLFRQGGFATNPPPPKDFVRETSPGDSDTQFVPAGRMPPPRTTKPRDPKGLRTLEQELDAARMKHDKISGRVVQDRPEKPGKPKKRVKPAAGDRVPPAVDEDTN